jgi:magnesium transporter
MNTELIKPEIRALIERRDWGALRTAVTEYHPAETADLLLELKTADRALFFRALPPDYATEAFAHFRPEQQDDLLRDLTDDETRRLLADLAPDDRTQLLAELPGTVTQRLMTLLSRDDLREARDLLGYPEESVGRLMTPDYVAVRPDWTAERALEHVRTIGEEPETATVVYVTDARWRILGVVSLRRILGADRDERIEDIMYRTVVRLAPADDREAAVRTAERYDLNVLPVVGSDGVLLGIVTIDDLIHVAEEEATEDFHRIGGSGLIRMSLRDASVRLLYQKRIGWLMILVFMNIFSGAGIAYFEDTLEAVIALAFFLPLLIDSGGNAGSQSATLMVRALATGDVHLKDWFRMLGRELPVAVLLGATMAAGVAFIASWRAPEVMAVVAITMVTIVVVGSLIGMLLPFLLTRFGLDPATASAPLITSLADISGVLIYFSIATWYLGIAAG